MSKIGYEKVDAVADVAFDEPDPKKVSDNVEGH